jgi:hypothetical protein
MREHVTQLARVPISTRALVLAMPRSARLSRWFARGQIAAVSNGTSANDLDRELVCRWTNPRQALEKTERTEALEILGWMGDENDLGRRRERPVERRKQQTARGGRRQGWRDSGEARARKFLGPATAGRQMLACHKALRLRRSLIPPLSSIPAWAPKAPPKASPKALDPLTEPLTPFRQVTAA